MVWELEGRSLVRYGGSYMYRPGREGGQTRPVLVFLAAVMEGAPSSVMSARNTLSCKRKADVHMGTIEARRPPVFLPSAPLPLLLAESYGRLLTISGEGVSFLTGDMPRPRCKLTAHYQEPLVRISPAVPPSVPCTAPSAQAFSSALFPRWYPWSCPTPC